MSPWTGVTCDANGTLVTQLQLSNQGLAGPLSDALAALDGLTVLDLSVNQLSGSLPAGWTAGNTPVASAATLTRLVLHNNTLGGPLPALSLQALEVATFHANSFTGSIPTSWATLLPPMASISILPQAGGGGLCGGISDRPSLTFVPQAGSSYPVTNSLGSCFQNCTGEPVVVSLAGTNEFDAAQLNAATVWDTAYLNPSAQDSVQIPCYASGSPAQSGGQPYLGGDMAFSMMAWGSAGSAGSVVANPPGTQECSYAASGPGSFWSVDLRYSLALSQVVITAGAGNLASATIAVSDSPVGATTECATSINVDSSAQTTVACAATGRYLTISSNTDLNLCSVAVYPQVSNAAVNKGYEATAANGQVLTGINGYSNTFNVVGNSASEATFVLDLGYRAKVAAVALSPSSNIASISLQTTSPLELAATGAASSSRRLKQQQTADQLAAAAAAAAAGAACTQSATSNNAFQCSGAQGQYVVVTGKPGATMSLDTLSVYLEQPPTTLPSPPPPPATVQSSPPPPANRYQTLWVGTLLVGGNIGNFINSAEYQNFILDAYNSAWSTALNDQGYFMNTNASYFTSVQPNVANPTASPYYFDGSVTGSNLFTNTSVAVDTRLTYSQLYSLLNTPNVAQAIVASIKGAYGSPVVWMVPYTAPTPNNGGGGLSTGAIIGIAAGGGVALLAAVVLLFCCCRGSKRHGRLDSGKSSVEDGRIEITRHRPDQQKPARQLAPGPQLAAAQQLYAEQQGKDGLGGANASMLPYGSAYSNGTVAAPASSNAAAAAAAAAATATVLAAGGVHHSRSLSAESSGALGAAINSSDTPRTTSDDPLLEWILKTQSPPVKGAPASASAAALTAAATMAATMAASDSQALAAARGTPKARASGSKALMDVRVWQFDFRDLEIQKQIGEGSFGRVYLAKWRETLVACKILMNTAVDIEDADDAERALTLSNPLLESLEKEASMMATLRHPNVVAFLGVCVSPPCVATEYCGRGSLTDVLRGGKNSAAKAKQLDWARRLNMALDAAKGMLYLHAHQPPIIHRDLKSPNLLVDKHWRVKVSDFNLSKLMEENSVMSSMAATNPRWLAPEILAGSNASFASDVYAFGVVLWELLTWELPWATTNPWQVVMLLGEGKRLELPPRSQIPGPDTQTWGELDNYYKLVDRCWAHEPMARPGFQEIIADLRDMLEQTLAAKGLLAGSSGGATPDAPGLAGLASGSGGALGAAAGARVGAAAGASPESGSASRASPPPDTPLSPTSLAALGASRGGSEVGTPMSGYSSMAAEVGSLSDGTPRTLLDSRVPSDTFSRQ